MKKIRFALLFLLTTIVGHSQFTESFNSAPANPLQVPDVGSWTPWNIGVNEWKIYNASGPGYTWRRHSGSYQGSYAAFLQRETLSSGAEDWLVTPQINLASLSEPELRFFSRLSLAGNQGGTYKVLISSSLQENVSSYSLVQQWTELEISPDQVSYHEIIVDLSGYTGNVYIAFVMIGNSDDHWWIDDVAVRSKCQEPENIGVTEITTNSAKITWTNPGESDEFEISNVLANNPPGVIDATVPGTFFNSTGLAEDTEYWCFIRPKCGSDNIGDWVGPIPYKTYAPGGACHVPIVIPNTEPYIQTNHSSKGHTNPYSGNPGTGCGFSTAGYLNGGWTVYSYTPAVGTTSITINVTSETSYHTGVFIYDNCADIGVNCIAGSADPSSLSENILNLPVSPGVPYYIVVAALAGYPSPYSITVSEGDCTTYMTADFEMQSDCELSSNFNVIVDMTNLGGSTSIVATPYVDGSEATLEAEIFTSVGQKTFGPYFPAEKVKILLQSEQNENCLVFSEVISKDDCPPANDDCSGAITMTANIDGLCSVVSGTLNGATASTQANTCQGDDNDDVWFKFTALSSEHLINIGVSGNVDINHAVYGGASCGDLTQLYCEQGNQSTVAGLVEGQTYWIRVYSAGSVATNAVFSICTLAYPYTCIDNNPSAANVRNLFKDLLNHLITVGSPLPNDPYNCPELIALTPYISVPNPEIHDFFSFGGGLSFSFTAGQSFPDVMISGIPEDESVTGIQFFSYLTPTGGASMSITYSDGTILNERNTAKLIEFCPEDPPCNPVAGNIKITPGLECMNIDDPHGFSLITDATNIEGYTWIFYDFDMHVVASSSLAAPVMTFTDSDTYIVQVIVHTSDGCDTTIEKVFSVMEDCSLYCTETNPQSPVVKELYLDLVNYLLETYGGDGDVATITTGFNCPQLVALAPYLTDASPLIYNLSYSNSTGLLRFSFADHGPGSYDVSVKNNGVVTDINLLGFTSPTVAVSFWTSYDSGSFVSSHSIKHVNFCPGLCPTIDGVINLESGISCVEADNPQMFNFQTSSSIISGYSWTFYEINSTSEIMATSTLSHPVMTYLEEGNYQVKLVASYGDGCKETFWKSITVSAACTGCTETNNTSAEVKQLYLNLVNYLLALGDVGPNPFTCAPLDALSAYITDNNPEIWNLSTAGGVLKFSFNDHGTDYDVSVPLTGQIADVNLMDYTSPDSAQSFPTIFQNGAISSAHSIKHIDFCPPTECDPLPGEIKLDPGLSCAALNVQHNFYLQGNITNITDYIWTFYNEAGNSYTTSILADPVMTYNIEGDYLVKLVVTENTGCKTTFYKNITVSAACGSACTETNDEAEDAKDLYIALLNSLLNMETIPDGYTSMELLMLSEYITDPDPAIYNAAWDGDVLSFSFSSSDSQPDVVIGNYGTIGDINLFDFATATVAANLVVTYTNGTVSDTHTVKHINFCPTPGICEAHVAFVIDESGSIDGTEALKIKAQLSSFIQQQLQYGTETTISFIGMSDSDNNTRTDHVYSKVTLDSKQDFDNWIDSYKSGYTAAEQAMGISPNSDYWASGLKQALDGYALEPEIVIVITDGSQTADIDGLMDIIQQTNSQSHLYVYGIGTGYYVDEDPFDVDPNNPSAPVSDVTLRLMSSLKYLMELPPSQFPVSGQYELLAASYFEYPDFSHLAADNTYFSDKLAAADIGCGGEIIPKDYCNDCETFQPYPYDDESKSVYWISGWVKEEHNIQVKTYTNAVIRLKFEDGDEEILGDISFTPSGDIIEGWQRVAAKFQVPAGTSIMKIELENLSSGIPVYFDDIRIHPINGSMKSFVYDPETFKLMAELDDNNYSTFYEYDKEGGLVRIKKETSKGVKTIQESRSGSVIQTTGN